MRQIKRIAVVGVVLGMLLVPATGAATAPEELGSAASLAVLGG